jgi:hypothetical protein
MRRTGIYHCRVKPGLCPGVPGASPGVVGHKRAAKGVLITTSRLGGADPGFRLLDAMLPSRPSAVGGLPTGHWSSVFRAEERAATPAGLALGPRRSPAVGRALDCSRASPGQNRGCSRTTELGTSDAGRAPVTLAVATDNGLLVRSPCTSAPGSPRAVRGRPTGAGDGRRRPSGVHVRRCRAGESPVPQDPRQDSEREGASRPFLP